MESGTSDSSDRPPTMVPGKRLSDQAIPGKNSFNKKKFFSYSFPFLLLSFLLIKIFSDTSFSERGHREVMQSIVDAYLAQQKCSVPNGYPHSTYMKPTEAV